VSLYIKYIGGSCNCNWHNYCTWYCNTIIFPEEKSQSEFFHQQLPVVRNSGEFTRQLKCYLLLIKLNICVILFHLQDKIDTRDNKQVTLIDFDLFFFLI